MARREAERHSVDDIVSHYFYEQLPSETDPARHGSRAGFKQPTLCCHERPPPMAVVLHRYNDSNGTANAAQFLWPQQMINLLPCSINTETQ
jgi:hypothetical protein